MNYEILDGKKQFDFLKTGSFNSWRQEHICIPQLSLKIIQNILKNSPIKIKNQTIQSRKNFYFQICQLKSYFICNCSSKYTSTSHNKLCGANDISHMLSDWTFSFAKQTNINYIKFCLQYSQYYKSSTMFGGLLAHSISISFNTYLVAFGCSFYHYSYGGNVLKVATLHKEPIVKFYNQSDRVYSVDKSGVLIISDGVNILESHKLNVTVSDAIFHEKNIIFLSQNKLYYSSVNKPQHKLKYTPIGTVAFLQKSGEYLLVGQANQVHIFSLEKGNLIKTIQNKSQVTCADINGQDIVVGDNKGRLFIYIGGLKQVTLQITVRHWHTGRVNKVILTDGNMISAGEQGVAVFWHLNTQKKDFLPRFGSQIKNLVLDLQSNKLACFLSDNSIKVVLLDQDKQIIHLRTILNPNGVKTKRSQIQDYKFVAGSNYSSSQNFVCLNSLPGRIQFIRPFRQLYELDVTNRNITSKLDQDYPNPIEVKCVSFSADWNNLAVYADNGDISFLKIFSKDIDTYQLKTRINNPHESGMIQIISYEDSKEITTKFVSIGSDKLLKVWKQRISKKKALKQNQNEICWSSQSNFSYKNRQFISIQPITLPTSNGVGIVLGDNHFILLDINSGEVLHEIFLQGMECCYYMGTNLAYHTDSFFSICDYTQKKNLFTLNTFIKRFSVSPSEQTIAVVHQYKGDQLLSLIELKKKKITMGKSYKIKNNENIQTIFWVEEVPIGVTSNLSMVSFGSTRFLTFGEQRKNSRIFQQEQQVEELSQLGFLDRYKNLVDRRLYSNQVQSQINDLMQTVRELPQVGNRFRLLSDIILH